MFSDPGSAVDLLFSVLSKLAYHGIDGVFERICDSWEQFRKTEDLFPFAFVEWAEWALWFLLADWADDDILRSRSLDDLREALGGMFDELEPESIQRVTDHVLGTAPGDVDADFIADIDDRRQQAAAIGFGFGRTLIEQEGWASQKALLAAKYFGGFLDYCADVDDHFGDQYTTDRAKKVKLLNRELKQLRDRLKGTGELTPHPDLAIGYARSIYHQGPLGKPYDAVAFTEAVVRLAPWMAERGLIDDPQLVDQIQTHFRRRINELWKSVTKLIDSDSVVDDALADTRQWLEADE